MTLRLSTTLVVGIEELDRQHEELLRRHADLKRSIEGDGGQADVVRAMTCLHAYALHHFATEETYMRRFSYPGLAAHAGEHERFLVATLGCKERLIASAQDPQDLAEMDRQLASWLIDHVTNADQPLGLFLRRAIRAARPGDTPPAGAGRARRSS